MVSAFADKSFETTVWAAAIFTTRSLFASGITCWTALLRFTTQRWRSTDSRIFHSFISDFRSEEKTPQAATLAGFGGGFNQKSTFWRRAPGDPGLFFGEGGNSHQPMNGG
jgi:hypothetical protein